MIRAAAQAVGQRVAAVSFISNLFRTDWHGSDDPTGDVLLFLRGFSDVKIRQKLFFQTYLSVYFFCKIMGCSSASFSGRLLSIFRFIHRNLRAIFVFHNEQRFYSFLLIFSRVRFPTLQPSLASLHRLLEGEKRCVTIL